MSDHRKRNLGSLSFNFGRKPSEKENPLFKARENIKNRTKSISLSRQKSVSTGLIAELQLNKKFREQKEKNISKSGSDEDVIKPKPEVEFNVKRKWKTVAQRVVPQRKSISLITLNPDRRKSFEELLKSFHQTSNEKYEPPPKNKFPTDENDEDCEVEFRRNTSSQSIRRYRSKTVDFNTDKDAVDIVGVQGLQYDKICVKFNALDVLRLENGNIYKLGENKNEKKLLVPKVKSITQTSKKEVLEVRDLRNNLYTFTFKKAHDAKLFTTNEKIQKYITESKISVGIRLRWLLGRRSSREVLEDKGIYKNEAIFGNTLQEIYQKNFNEVPKFVQRTIQLIERPENIKSVGLYRTSGNLATIQKIRLEVDNGRLGILEQYERDVDVLTGCLKMFFRELKEPLITCETCEKLLEVIRASQKIMSKKDRDKIKSILTTELYEGNLETFLLIIAHLINVVKYKELNKMDSYNLAVCWGPSAIFSLSLDPTRDIVSQSHDATRLLDFFINYYKENPEEMETITKKNPSITDIQRQISQDTFKSSSSSLSYMVDEIIKKIVEIIEKDMRSEGLYKKSGSVEKSGKILKKMTKKKYTELEKCKGDIHDFTDAFKKYLRDSPTFVNKENVEKVLNVCGDINEYTIRQKIARIVEDFNKKDTFIFVLKHIIKVIDNESYHKVSKSDIIDIWTKVLNYQEKVCLNQNFSRFLTILLEVFDDNKLNKYYCRNSPQMSNVIKDVEKLQKENDRHSKYDNVPEKGEASFLDDDNNNFKTEQTKL